MLVGCLSLVLLAQTARAPQEREPAVQYEVNANNWPVRTVVPDRLPARPETEPGGLRPRDAAVPVRVDEQHPLRQVFAAIGSPADLAALGVVRQRMQLRVLDHRGASLADLAIEHEADLADSSRDRVSFDGTRLFGRDGNHAFAVYRGLAFPAMEAEAAVELAWYGLVLRAPWVFADARGFSVAPREELLRDGRPMSRFRIEARATPQDLVGPAAPAPEVDRYELWCDADNHEPRLLVMLPSGVERRPCVVRFSEFVATGNVRWPTRRVVESGDGSKRLEFTVLETQVRLPVPARHFAPPAR